MAGDSARNRKNGFETLDGNETKMKLPVNNPGKIFAIICAILIVLIVVFDSTYEIGEQEQAVLITFGKAQAITNSGLHFKIPVIQQVKKVNTTIQGFSIGYDLKTNETKEAESLMITSDYNFVNVDFFVEYRFSDPVKAVYASEDPEEILRNISQSCIRSVIGSYPVDTVLTTGKNEIQSTIKDMINATLEKWLWHSKQWKQQSREKKPLSTMPINIVMSRFLPPRLKQIKS